jgi:hypothetical protein
MKGLIFIVLFISAPMSILAQVSQFEIFSSLAFQGTDERIFGLNDMWVEELTERNNDKFLPSTYFDIGLSYRLLSRNNFSLKTGVKYGYEWNNSYRTYNHCIIEGNPCSKILAFADGYGYNLFGSFVSLELKFNIGISKKLVLGVSISPMMRFLTYYDGVYKYLWKVEYLFTEITPYVGTTYKEFEIGLYTRIWQNRKVDRGIYPTTSGSGHPIILDNYMDINPWKIGLYFKHNIPFSKKVGKLD